MLKTMPRDFLCDKELIGFIRAKLGERMVRRATSAKETEPADPLEIAVTSTKSDK
jgi:hypothetical protein